MDKRAHEDNDTDTIERSAERAEKRHRVTLDEDGARGDPSISRSHHPTEEKDVQEEGAEEERDDTVERTKGASTSDYDPDKVASRDAANGVAAKGPRPSPPWHPDDKDGHMVYELGESLTARYKILSKVGEGTFGRVLECWDREKKAYCAIKVIRNVQKYRDAAMIEIDVLRTIAKADPKGRRHCVALQDWFDYRGHVCMVFEKLGLSLYDFLRKNHYKPFNIDLVREFGVQLLESVAFLHDLTLIHTDLKPENILLQSPEYNRERVGVGKHSKRVPVSHLIKLIDFGSATFNDQYHSTVVSTRHYRAPEVILGLGWTFPCDIWSIGCILIELMTGDALFQTHENLEHLAMMEAVLGPIPKDMIQSSDRHCHKYFRHAVRELNWPEGASSRESVRAVRKMFKLQDTLLSEGRTKAHKEMVELLKGMLKYNPKERMSARNALEHPFFLGAKSGTLLAGARSEDNVSEGIEQRGAERATSVRESKESKSLSRSEGREESFRSLSRKESKSLT
mmetsp:Transcript_38014/g.82650  ORF Transcript_38014/g.82650 Transcript_38014/m.82650 type:complete len:510 (-) Transcript_38014:270-1799(-)